MEWSDWRFQRALVFIYNFGGVEGADEGKRLS